MSGYHSPQLDVAVRLNTNESPWPPPPGWHDALARGMATIEWNRYPDRSARDLCQALARHHGVDESQIFAANGSNEVIQCLCLAFAGPGRHVAVFEPTYRLHSHIAGLTGTGVIVGGRADDLTLDLAEVQRVLADGGDEGPALTFVCSPNNPTGIVERPEVIAAVADQAPGLVVVDAAYGDFGEGSFQGRLDDDANVVTTRTFSKTWAMAGARLGYAVAPTWVVDALDAVVLPYHLDAFQLLAGRLALDFADAMDDRVAALVAERERLVAGLDRLGIEQWPSGANFVLFRAPGGDGCRVWDGLVERSVLVRDTSSWPGLDRCLRVTVGTPEEDDAFLTALGEVI